MSDANFRVPLSLILDDGAPINAAYFMHPEEEHEALIPNSFTDQFAAICEARGVLGKYSVLPMPSGAGRIDHSLSYVSDEDLADYIDIVRSRLAGRFDITPEILTWPPTTSITIVYCIATRTNGSPRPALLT